MTAQEKMRIYIELGKFIAKTEDPFVLKAMLSEIILHSTDDYYLQLYTNYINCNYEK
jgi:hypothetical protein